MFLSTAIMLFPPLCYLVGALLSRHGSHKLGWSVANACALLALLVSILAVALFLFWPPSALLPWLAAAPVNLLLSVLISLIGFTVVRYSVAYLAGDLAECRYRVWLQLCLASVSFVVVSDHLLLLRSEERR